MYHNILDISQSQHQIVRVRKGSNKKSFAFKVFQFCDSKLQQRFFLKEEVSISKKEIETSLVSSGEFLKAFDQSRKISQIPLPKPKFEIGFTIAKDELFSHCYKDINEHLNRQIRLSFRFEKNKTCVFSIKNLTNTVVNSFLQKLSTWVTVKANISTRIDFLFLTSVIFLRAITMCSASTPDCGYDKSTIILIGDVYCPKTKKSLGKLCLHKKTFQYFGRSDCRWESIRGYVTTPRSIYGCVRCGAWLFIHKVLLRYKST